MPISAFGYTSSTSSEYEGTSTEDERIETSASKTSAWCKLKINQLSWPSAYNGGTDAFAWVGFDDSATQSVTATWCMSSTWTLDYRLSCSTGGFNWYSKIELRVVYQIWSLNGSLLQEKEAWMGYLETGSGLKNFEETITRTIEKSFTVDLQKDYCYVFKIALKVTIADLGSEYQLTANSNHNNPAILSISSISYYLP